MLLHRTSVAAVVAGLLLAGCGDSPSRPPVVQPDCPVLELTAGQQRIFGQAEGLCFGLLATSNNEAYLVGVQSTSGTLSSLTPVTLSLTPKGAGGVAGAPAMPGNGAVVPAPAMVAAALQDPELRLQGQRLAAHRRSELELRAQERRHLRLDALPPRQRVQPFALPGLQASVSAGDTMTLRIPDRTKDSGTVDEYCSNYVEVRAVARVVGQRGVWLEDVGNPAGGYSLADFQEMSQLFDNTIYPRVVDYFGAPSDIDGNGRILILTTKEINRFNAARPDRPILGFVASADFFPRQGVEGCALSNEAEIYYGVAPDPGRAYAWPDTGSYSLARAKADVINLIPHEFTHIIQFGRRITNPQATRLQATWELEGQAMLSEEVVGHAFTGRSPGSNYGFAVSTSDWYWGHFVDLILYYGLDLDDPELDSKVPNAPEQCSWVDLGNGSGDNGPCKGRHVYGVPWSLLRWASDHFGEQTVQRQLIDNVTQSGFTNLSQVTGQPATTLLAQWAAMLYVDDRVSSAATRLTMPSWNLWDLFSRAPAAYQLQPHQRGFTAFSDTLSVRAGSTGYYRLSGANRPVSDVRVAARGGGTLPAHMQLWVVRLQ